MTRQLRHQTAIAAAILLIAPFFAMACGRPGDSASSGTPASSLQQRGGDLRISLRSEPQSFNWYARTDSSTYLVTVLTHAVLVRVNRLTDEVEPWLAESWTRSADGLQYTLKLRDGVTFADGQPFTADDVVFSLAAANDEKGGSVLADSMRVGNKNLHAASTDARTIVLTFPEPFGPGLRILDNLPILPKHKLQNAVPGNIGKMWNTSTPPAEMTGLGPFILTEYVTGQRIVFERNPRYFRRDGAGTQLPLLDRILVEMVTDQDAEILRLESGQTDMSATEIRPVDYGRIKRVADEGRLQLFDLGVALAADAMWFNLKPGAFAGDPRASWIQRDELRQAISLAVDRQRFADTVFLGAAVPVSGPITPGNKKWYAPELPEVVHDPARAKTLLASIGLMDRDGDGLLEDPQKRPARFTLLTGKGQAQYERGIAVIRDELKKIGLSVDAVAIDPNTLVGQFLSGKGYDAVYFSIFPSDTDPALNLDFWSTSGYAHIWNFGQSSPATSWEREIDRLMARQAASLDAGERHTLFAEVQKIFAAHEPMLYFAAPRIYVAASSRVANLRPMLRRPQGLWAADILAVRH